jgi:hypothetical protein
MSQIYTDAIDEMDPALAHHDQANGVEMMKVFYDSLSERPDRETQNTKHEYRKKEEPFICKVKLHLDSCVEKLNARILIRGTI